MAPALSTPAEEELKGVTGRFRKASLLNRRWHQMGLKDGGGNEAGTVYSGDPHAPGK